MSADYFYSINRNIDCDTLFTGEWICIWGHMKLEVSLFYSNQTWNNFWIM